jgi:chemotaxis protein histidine kinase CheA
MAAATEDDFQKELLDIFVQEAQEGLQNIHVALDELQQGPAPDRHAKLIKTIWVGVMNLGGSAATINLPDVEQASFGAIPFIEAIQDPQKALSVRDCTSLCKQLGQIHTALTRATGISFNADERGATAEAIAASLSLKEFLQALEELQKKPSSNIASGRNIVRSLIEYLEEQVQADVERIDATVIQGYLARVTKAEESFLKSIDEQLPWIAEKMSALTIEEGEGSSIMPVLDASLQVVARLRTEAQEVNAGSAIIFFTGLHSLLDVMARRRVLLAAARVESVKARLLVMGGAIRQWVEHGRAQRAAIDELLPAG